MTEILKRVERFTLGIEKYGYNSEFRQKIELLAEQQPMDIEEIDKILDEYQIPRNK